MINDGMWKQMRHGKSKGVSQRQATIRSQSMRTTKLQNNGTKREPNKKTPSLPKLKFMEGDEALDEADRKRFGFVDSWG